MKSVMSFPQRGNYGKSNWRGNMSGYTIMELIKHFNPRFVVDVCEGSGTSGDVCRELGIKYRGLDLYKGNDFTKDSVLQEIGSPADLVFSHPPYHDMIKYSGNVWGSPHSADTSLCHSPDEFLEKSQVMLLNQREATKQGGIYSTLIGDQRSKSTGFRSYQSDFIQMMPKDELISVTIKLQHNCLSDNRKYNGNFIPILHEYLLVWKKAEKSMFQVVWDSAVETKKQLAATWRSAIRIALMRLGGQAKLSDIYFEVERMAGHLIANNSNYKAKIRQSL
ncbi:MAG: hypothetical protein COB67_00010 [SAR324 cluster bacterium]|uniref:DNA methylase N-4/N-6 domain-containing protein n=1 Tax=SAR324 cluster bacterium TaxID=2024889 RepID=A0A2A4TBG8_9DELT|nr:MAG: hypothetical protein COB67_00010 [SAR324 cluster bacterium]